MKATTVKVPRFASQHAWTHRILRIDLSAMKVWAQGTAPYVPDFLGARGLAARIAWEEYAQPVEPFDPANPLMIFAGALTGSRAAYSGRATVCTFSPQGYPHRWFTRSNIGGHFGGELRRAGYDGLIVTGAAETPVRILIRDDEVSILPADELWGQDALKTIEDLEGRDGRHARSLTIGQAGERLSHIATIQTASSSACGHGGFGAVMGSKKLKAITVLGTGQVSLADPERVEMLTKGIRDEVRSARDPSGSLQRLNAQLAEAGEGRARVYACTESCPTPCNIYYADVPGSVHNRTFSGHWTCVGSIFRGIGEGSGPVNRRGVFDWRLGVRGGLEMNVLSNGYGLNQWDLIIGMVPWLEACQSAGLISELNGKAMDWRSPVFWAEFLRSIAYREGLGDTLAEGGWAAARKLHLGEELMRRYYTAWGHAGHWDGHGDLANYIVFPFWLVPALQWLTDTRDPIPSGHGYGSRVMAYGPFSVAAQADPSKGLTWEQMRGVAARIYGDPNAVDPASGYQSKGAPAFWHTKRSVMKDCLPVDDNVFPLIYSRNSADGLARAAGIEGPSLEYHLFKAGTGVAWSEGEFEEAAARVYTLERALTVRHWGRDRQVDELVLPAFTYAENWPSPLLKEPQALDPQQFKPVMDEYYTCQGWDVQSGWPTRARLEALGLGAMYDPMVQGAQRERAAT